MICSCGGRVRTSVNTLKTRKALLEWIPGATDHPLPAELTVRRCTACGRLDKQLKTERGCAGDRSGGVMTAASGHPDCGQRPALVVD